MATSTTLKADKGGPWCSRFGLIRAQDVPKSNVLSTTDLSQYATLELHTQELQTSKSIEYNVNLVLLRRFRLSIYSDYSLHTLLGIPADHSKNLFLSNLHIDYDYAIAISREAYAPFTSRQTCL